MLSSRARLGAGNVDLDLGRSELRLGRERRALARRCFRLPRLTLVTQREVGRLRVERADVRSAAETATRRDQQQLMALVGRVSGLESARSPRRARVRTSHSTRWCWVWRGSRTGVYSILLGFIATFGSGTTWGVLAYTPTDFASTEPFLIAFFVIYLSITYFPNICASTHRPALYRRAYRRLSCDLKRAKRGRPSLSCR